VAELGIVLRTYLPIQAGIELAQEAERRGFHSVWTTESMDAKDAFTQMAAYAMKTQSIRIGSGIVPIYLRTPILTGMSALGLAELSGERAILGLGASHPFIVENGHGVKLERPLQRMREYVEIIRLMREKRQFSYHGQIFNASEIGKSLEVSDHTAQRYMDLLSGTFMVRQLRPWHYNTKKRIIKRPKIYFRDSGILHTLLSLEEKNDILSHPKLGASWEGFALEEVIKALYLKEDEAFFWGVHSAAELDLVFEKKGGLYGIEVKYTQAPSFTPSMRSALAELSLKHLWLIYPGKEEYPLSRNVTAIPLAGLDKIISSYL
jgi:hypothetical protein